MNCPARRPIALVIHADIGGVVGLQDIALQADHRDAGLHRLAHHRGQRGAFVGRDDQDRRLLPDEGFDLGDLLAVVLLRIRDHQLGVRRSGEQLLHQRLLRRPIGLGIVGLGKGHQFLLRLLIAAPGQQKRHADAENPQTCRCHVFRLRCTATARTMMTALIIISTLLSILLRRSMLVSTPMIRVPMMVPAIVPWPPDKPRAADHHRRDGVQFIGDARIGIALVVLGGIEHAGKSGQQARQGIDPQLRPQDGKSGIDRRRGIVADGADMAAEHGFRQQQPEQRCRGHIAADDDGFLAEDAGELRRDVLAEADIDILVAGKPFGETPDPDHRRQGGDEGLHPQPRDDKPVERAHGTAGEHGQQRCWRKSEIPARRRPSHAPARSPPARWTAPARCRR